jgi:DNA primase catalytic subunit
MHAKEGASWLRLRWRHVRLKTACGWVKVKREVKSVRELERYSYVKAYVSLARYLFPWRVGPLYTLHTAYPLGTDFGVDVDGYMSRRPLTMRVYRGSQGLYEDEVEYARLLALEALDALRQNYASIKAVFTGRRGYQLWVLDFDWRDWVGREPRSLRDMVRLMAQAKARYTRVLAAQLAWIDRAHCNVMRDLTRVFALPGTVDRRTGLAVVEVDLGKPAVEHIMCSARMAAREWGPARRQALQCRDVGMSRSLSPRREAAYR